MRCNREAFTLLEVLMATFIVASLMMMVSYVFWQSFSIWEKGDRRLKMCQNARYGIDVMNREIRAAFISESNSCLFFKGDERALNFISVSHKANRKGEYDLCELGYYLKDSHLRRMVKSHLDSRPGEGGSTAVLANGILELFFSYYSGEKWHKSWDSTMGTPDDITDDALPQMVQIKLESQDEESKEKLLVFSSIVYIPSSAKRKISFTSS